MGRLATDIGGTFTDLVYFDEKTGDLKIAKSLTTPKDLLRESSTPSSKARSQGSEVGFFVHGGTTVINAITERKGVKTALVTTAGFRDVLEIARGNRPDLYNLRFVKETAFVPRALRFEVRERVDAKGRVLQPLRSGRPGAVADACRRERVEAIAVLFLHSYVAPAHEIACAEQLRKRLPGIPVTAPTKLRGNGASTSARTRPYSTRMSSRSSSNISTGLKRDWSSSSSIALISRCNRTAARQAFVGRKSIRSRSSSPARPPE